MNNRISYKNPLTIRLNLCSNFIMVQNDLMNVIMEILFIRNKYILCRSSILIVNMDLRTIFFLVLFILKVSFKHNPSDILFHSENLFILFLLDGKTSFLFYFSASLFHLFSAALSIIPIIGSIFPGALNYLSSTLFKSSDKRLFGKYHNAGNSYNQQKQCCSSK